MIDAMTVCVQLSWGPLTQSVRMPVPASAADYAEAAGSLKEWSDWVRERFPSEKAWNDWRSEHGLPA